MGKWQVEWRDHVSEDAPAEEQRPWQRKEYEGDATLAEIDEVEFFGTYDVRLRFVDDLGRFSEWQPFDPVFIEPELDTPLPQAESIRIECNNLMWGWRPAPGIGRVGWLVRHAYGLYLNWNDALPAHEGILFAPPLPLCRMPRGPRTFMVRAIDENGIMGPITYVPVQNGDFDYRKEFTTETEAHAGPSFPGTIVEGVVSGPNIVGAVLQTFWTGDQRLFWSGDPTALYWRDRYGDVVYEVDFKPAVPSLGSLHDHVISLNPSVVGENWQVQYRYASQAFWTGNPKASFWHADLARMWIPESDAGPMWGEPSDPFWTGIPTARYWEHYRFEQWPGRIDQLERGKFTMRVVVPGGRSQIQLKTLDVSVSRDYITASELPLLDAEGKVPNSLLHTGPGGGLDADTLDGKHAADLDPGRLVGKQQFVGNGTYTVPVGVTSIVAEVWGAGGGGGGADTAAAPPPPGAAGGGGGAAGAYARKRIAVTAGQQFAVTVGIGGPGGIGGPPPMPGVAGGLSRFGPVGTGVTAPGGGGGAAGPNSLVDAIVPGGVSGLATNGDENGLGQPGGIGKVLGGATLGLGGMGGSTSMGGGGDEINGGPGLPGGGVGAGGGGAGALAGLSFAGGAGTNGLVVVWEYS